MSTKDRKIWVVYNGEIYNYIEIARELSALGHRFLTRTDTEVILHAYEEWGVGCLNHFNGMWAFVLWDSRTRKLFCSRDRVGVKPFYYSYDGKGFCFASEIKALLEIDEFKIEPNEQIVADYLFWGVLDHTQETFFNNIYQLRPGDYLLLEANKLIISSYWDIEAKEIVFRKQGDYAERFSALLQDSIRLRLRSDVPIGTCLSGGLDSSSIVCLANKLMFSTENIEPGLVGERQKTFSSCSENPDYDERSFIEMVARQTGVETNYVFPKVEDLFRELSCLLWHQDEPFGSTSIYAQWDVMRLARERGVTVLLDGQGGDELLAGYLPSFYFVLRQALTRLDIGCLVSEGLGLLRNHAQMTKQLGKRMSGILFPKTKEEIEWSDERFRKKYFRRLSEPAKFDNDLDNYLYHIFRYSKLPGLLHYEDRNSMAFSIETRLPFLDYRLVEYSFSLPREMKIRNGMTKSILRDAMKGILPEKVRKRVDKMGFVTPEPIWFKTSLKNRISEIISSKSFAERGYYDVGKVKKGFNDHCQGKVDFSLALWRYVNLELWLRLFADRQFPA